MKQPILTVAAALLTLANVHAGTSAKSGKDFIEANWLTNRIEPVTNPIFFEDPSIVSSIRPIFMYHNIDRDFVTKGGDVHVYALQLRYAITERLAFIATKDGFIDFDPNAVLTDQEGWGDVSVGLKYALIDNRPAEFILTPGFKFEIPLGNQNVFQGKSVGEWDVFVAASKGFDKFHLTGNVGFRIPNDFSEKTSQFHFSAQADYYTCRYFIPFVAVNGFTVLTEANTIGLDVEGSDLINFGSSNAGGSTQVALGAGFRSRVLDNLDLGFAYEKGVGADKGLYDQRFTVDMVVRF